MKGRITHHPILRVDSLIRPLKLGNVTFATNIIQGPLAGVSSAPFRRLLWQYSQPAFACTEMISCNTLMHQSAKSLQRFVYKHPSEGALCFQLSANDPALLAQATKKATDLGADLIDLNCGCPVKKIRGKGAGSRLLSDASRIYQLITAMKNNTHLPVSIKIRVDGASGDQFNRDIVNAVNDAGVDYLIVHGRHWQEQYEVACRYDEIEFFVSEVKAPVVGNGDVSCAASLKKMLDTGCAGVMIGRAGVGQPWLISSMIGEFDGKTVVLPSQVDIGKMYQQHVADLAELLGNEKFAILDARKLAKYYARKLDHKLEFCAAINECENLASLNEICHRYFL